MVEEELFFNTSWNVQARDFAGKVQSRQEIQIQGLSENMRNEMHFYNFEHRSFSVDMENENIGRVSGTGVFDDKLIAWEFRSSELNFEGYETYHLQLDGSYLMKGEYITSDQFRTKIQATLSLRSKEVPPIEEEPDEEEGL